MRPENEQPTLESLHARCEEVGECWEWGGYYNNGVPCVFIDNKRVGVRRVVAVLSGKRVQGRLNFGNSCDNRRCVNPEHVIGRTMEQHARHIGIKAEGSVLRAAKIQMSWAGRTKLTFEQVQEIRASEDGPKVLSERYGVSKNYIHKIRKGLVWRHFGGVWSGLF